MLIGSENIQKSDINITYLKYIYVFIEKNHVFIVIQKISFFVDF